MSKPGSGSTQRFGCNKVHMSSSLAKTTEFSTWDSMPVKPIWSDSSTSVLPKLGSPCVGIPSPSPVSQPGYLGWLGPIPSIPKSSLSTSKEGSHSPFPSRSPKPSQSPSSSPDQWGTGSRL